MAKRMTATLVSKTKETQTVSTFVFSLDEEFSFIPGQYVFLEFPEQDEMKRPFSILHYDALNNELSLGIKKNGDFTQKLFAAAPGEPFIVAGPFGRFIATKKKTAFIAGGIGITPIYTMMFHRSNADDFVFFSARSESEFPYFERIQSLEHGTKKFFFTRDASDKGVHGRITAEHILSSIPDKDEYEFMICGPEGMIDEVRAGLMDKGVIPHRIKSEVF